MIRPLLTLLMACTLASGSSLATAQDAPTIIYPASVVTMDEAMPTAGAVAVRDGMIVALGDPDELAIELPAARIDSRFAAHVIVPGFGLADKQGVFDPLPVQAIFADGVGDVVMVGEDQVEEVVKTLVPDDIHISNFEFAKSISGVHTQLLRFNSIFIILSRFFYGRNASL